MKEYTSVQKTKTTKKPGTLWNHNYRIIPKGFRLRETWKRTRDQSSLCSLSTPINTLLFHSSARTLHLNKPEKPASLPKRWTEEELLDLITNISMKKTHCTKWLEKGIPNTNAKSHCQRIWSRFSSAFRYIIRQKEIIQQKSPTLKPWKYYR